MKIKWKRWKKKYRKRNADIESIWMTHRKCSNFDLQKLFTDAFFQSVFFRVFSSLTMLFGCIKNEILHVLCEHMCKIYEINHIIHESIAQGVKWNRLFTCVCESVNHTKQSHQIGINCQLVELMKLMLSSRFIEWNFRNFIYCFIQKYIYYVFVSFIARPQGQ